jgi:hypothetical protein
MNSCVVQIRAWIGWNSTLTIWKSGLYTRHGAQGHSGATTTSYGGIIFSTTWGTSVRGHTVWLKTFNLVLMGGTPQHILLNSCCFIFALSCFIFVFLTYFSVVFSGTKGYFSLSLGVCYEPCLSR